MSYGHKVGKHTHTLMTEYIRVEDGGNMITSTEKHETHAHCIDIYRTVQNSRLYQSDKKIISRLNTSHHMDDTSHILATCSWYNAKSSSKLFTHTNRRKFKFSEDTKTTGEIITNISMPGTLIKRKDSM
eukprot:4130948-Heterocapsa_arctica.AAC.1